MRLLSKSRILILGLLGFLFLALTYTLVGASKAKTIPKEQEEEEAQLTVDKRSITTTGERIGFILKPFGFQGFVQAFSGGIIRGEVAAVRTFENRIEKKQIIRVLYEPITVEVGMDMAIDFYAWISRNFDGMNVSKNGEIVVYDFDGLSKSIHAFHDAYISEVTLPELDSNRREPVILRVEMEPGLIHTKPGSGSHLPGSVNPAPRGVKWLRSNFRFTLGDLPCARVTKIDSFTWKLEVARDKVGQFRVATKHPYRIAIVPNIKLTISMSDIKPWQDWHRSFVIEGKHSEADELSGRIDFLSTDGSESIASIGLFNVGIFSLRKVGQENSGGAVSRFEVELYVERMTFHFHDPPVRTGG